MENEKIRQEIGKNDYWYYQFDLQGNPTTPNRGGWVQKHLRRKEYFFDPLVALLGGSLAGKRVLDLGCNAGFWSLLAVESGSDFVLGVDGRQEFIDQANLVFDVKGVDKQKYAFIRGNVYDVDFKKWGAFDIVFFLGLMYHLSKPMLLMERISEVNPDILVIDTRLSRIPSACLEIRRQSAFHNKLSSIDYRIEFFPTKQAVITMAEEAGYKVAQLKPRFTENTGANEYRFGSRRAFICAKISDLSHLGAPTEKTTAASQFADLLMWSLRRLSRTALARQLARVAPKRWITSVKEATV